MMTSILDGKFARVHQEDADALKQQKLLTLLLDGWEDKMQQSLYSSVIAGVSENPVVLSLDELTSQHENADKLLETAENALTKASVPEKNVITFVTDNPSVMCLLHKKFADKHPWILVS